MLYKSKIRQKTEAASGRAGRFLYVKGIVLKDYKESKPFYHTAAWRRAREAALARDRGMCRDCMDLFEAGTGFRPRRAALVHHDIPVEVRPDLAYDLQNLRSLCGPCHNRQHPEKGSGREEEQEAQGIARRMRVIKV